MKKLIFVLLSFSLLTAMPPGAFAQEPQTVYTRGNNELPEGYTHASFKGGGLLDFKFSVAELLRVPEGIEIQEPSGRVIVSMVVNEKGILEDVEVLSSPHPLCSQAVLDAIAAVRGKWKAGKDPKGKPVRIRYLLPVEFAFETPEDTSGQSPDPDAIEGTLPTFNKGDLIEFRQWVMKRADYPKELRKAGIKGDVVVTFVIDRDGSVTSVKVVSGLRPVLDAETVRVIEESPKWEPGCDENGNPVKVLFKMPVSFGK
ncbi:MAG: energy transducer TonB [Alistipes sp.]|nr:energy transducer TonB [Alistipes sp.]